MADQIVAESGANTIDVNDPALAARAARQRRKAAWAQAEISVRKVLLAWMEDHPGVPMDESVSGECVKAGTACFSDLDTPIGCASDPRSEAQMVAGLARKTFKALRAERPFRVERTEQEWNALFPRYPSSESGDGFMMALDADESEGIRATMAKYGLCVIRGALSEETCDATVAAMFDEVNEDRTRLGMTGPAVSPSDPASWDTKNWPAKSKFLVRKVALHPQAFANRCAPSVVKVFEALFKTSKLRATVDNWGIVRGAKHNPKWKAGLKPHWDLNPFSFRGYCDKGQDPGYQGLIALSDQTLETGCHLTLPGGTSFLPLWIKENVMPLTVNRKSLRPDQDDPIVKYMQPIPLRKGEMVVWSWGQLHGSTDSDSDVLRLQQYVRLYPSPEAGEAYDYEGHDRYGCVKTLRRCQKDGNVTADELLGILTNSMSSDFLG
eukprot:CAMPEP_0197450648 /NCGR_PEP_ID=MMETSP1175-20131217/26045_1 /TAXON_ID=1003142 /ORGANISM="Triceratium dubium, Strain CCMP147" /LENGTH=436 /DNA_ID=CAMNT_0042983111 /DNA_START=19 /DNA_END=1330 /DNA_ORIENTATION=+